MTPKGGIAGGWQRVQSGYLVQIALPLPTFFRAWGQKSRQKERKGPDFFLKVPIRVLTRALQMSGSKSKARMDDYAEI